MNGFWENIIVITAARYSVVVLCTVVFLAIFELVTSYKNWEEIKKGIWQLHWQRVEKYSVLLRFSVTRLNIMTPYYNL